MHQVRMGRNTVKSSSPNAPSTGLIFPSAHTHASLQTCYHSASGVLAVWISCQVIAVFVCVQTAKRRMGNRLRYFLTNKIFLLQVMYRYICMILIVKCVKITHVFIDGKAWFLLFCHPLKLYVILYSTGTVFFHCCFVSWRLG